MRLHLKYGREGDAYAGNLLFEDAADATKESILKFAVLSFERMFLKLASYALQYPEAELYTSRTEQPGVPPERLGTKLEEMLRKDPAATVATLSQQHLVAQAAIQVEDQPKVRDVVKVRLRVGHDTLAEAFGDELYCEVRCDKGVFLGQCPLTSDWVGFGLKESQFLLKVENPFAWETWLPVALAPNTTVENPRWARVKTKVLLARGCDKYYFPREWNKNGPWISHEDLTALYEAYKKEKEDVQHTTSGSEGT